MQKRLLIAVLTLPLTQVLQAQLAPPPFLLGGEYQLPSDLDGGGSFSRATIRGRVSAPLYLGEDTIVALGGSLQFDSFQFDDLPQDPWSEIYRSRIALVAKQNFGENWTWLAIPWVATDRESGADWGDSLTFGGITAAWYRISNSLSIGLGAGFASRLEDNIAAFPILVIDWKLTESLTFSTIPPEGFRVGPGINLRWDTHDNLSLTLVYQYQGDQHRLDENSPSSPNGIGEFRQSRAALAASYRFNENLSLTGHISLAFQGNLELQNEDGDILSERDFDSSLVFGLEGSWRF